MKRAFRKASLLTVGGLDPSGCAGVLADARVWDFFGLPGRAVLTAVTAQSERKFFSWKPVDLKLFRAQLHAVDGPLFGVKIGMLATTGHLRILLKFLRSRRPRWILWDPVLRSSTGKKLLRVSRPDSLIRTLLAVTDVFTPNVPEAEWFLGRKISDSNEMTAAAQELASLMKKGSVVVLKGGHLASRAARGKSVDLVVWKQKLHHLAAKRRPGDRRGTGCAFGAALLAALARGKNPLAAARAAKHYVLTQLFDSFRD
jgi:hydroxymethylpyrimidine/phosphomethylpyrimidine kinase